MFCGSSTGKRDCYRDAAIELGQELVPIVYSICMPFSVSCSPQNQTDVLCFEFFSNCLLKCLQEFCVLFVKVSRKLDLVYGGGSIGLMGLVSQAVHGGGGHVLGYIQPHHSNIH